MLQDFMRKHGYHKAVVVTDGGIYSDTDQPPEGKLDIHLVVPEDVNLVLDYGLNALGYSFTKVKLKVDHGTPWGGKLSISEVFA